MGKGDKVTSSYEKQRITACGTRESGAPGKLKSSKTPSSIQQSRKQLDVRRVVGSNKDLAEASAAVINCGPGPVKGTKLSKKRSVFPLLSAAILCAR